MTRIIVDYEEQPGVWFASCDALKWSGSGQTLDEARQASSEGLAFALGDSVRSEVFWHRNRFSDAPPGGTFEIFAEGNDA